VVIDASGRAARLGSYVGAKRLLLDRLVGVATQFGGIDVAREGYVMVETTAEGWWYTAPVPGDCMMVMLMTDSDLCGRFHLASAEAWLAKLEMAPATQARVAGCRPSWGPRVFGAASQRLERSERRAQWLAVGDAALAVDPISGSGIVRALRSARAAAETTWALLENHEEDSLEAYEAERDSQCLQYLNERAMYYALEQRWQEHAFWARRCGATGH